MKPVITCIAAGFIIALLPSIVWAVVGLAVMALVFVAGLWAGLQIVRGAVRA
jgi:hypothetical protein